MSLTRIKKEILVPSIFFKEIAWTLSRSLVLFHSSLLLFPSLNWSFTRVLPFKAWNPISQYIWHNTNSKFKISTFLLALLLFSVKERFSSSLFLSSCWIEVINLILFYILYIIYNVSYSVSIFDAAFLLQNIENCLV